MIRTVKLYSSELQVLEMEERYWKRLLLKNPYSACKQERKEGEDSQAHFEVLLPMSIVFSEIYGVYWIYG